MYILILKLNLLSMYVIYIQIYNDLNKANTSDIETSFLDLIFKVIGSNIQTSVYDKRDDFGFPIVNFPWLSGDVPRLPLYGIYLERKKKRIFTLNNICIKYIFIV